MTNTKPTIQITQVTPAMARAWLTHNTHNRNLAETVVARYHADMIEGRWQFAADPIRFDTTGRLLDGQHRLHALATCPDTVTIPLLIVTKLPAETQKVMDQGRKRTAGQQLGLFGVKDANVVAAAVRLLLAHDSGLLFRAQGLQVNTITTTRIQEWVADNAALVEQASAVPGYRVSTCPTSVSFCAALMFIQHIGTEPTIEFFRLLHAGTAEGHPINALDRRLRRIKDYKLKMSSRELLALFIQAVNAWLEGRSLTKLQVPRGGVWTATNFPRLRAVS